MSSFFNAFIKVLLEVFKTALVTLANTSPMRAKGLPRCGVPKKTMPKVAVKIEIYTSPSLACTRACGIISTHTKGKQLAEPVLCVDIETYLFDNNSTQTVSNEQNRTSFTTLFYISAPFFPLLHER